MIKFGLGCFHFKLKEYASFDNYTKLLKEELDKVTNISNLEIVNIEDGIKSGFLPIDQEDIEKFNFEDSTGFYPPFFLGKISFDIFIPKKAQNKVADEISYHNNEFFKVEIYFGYIFTYTIIEPQNTLSHEDGSLAVILVREFLSRELGDIKDSKFELEVLGPSPFHADFELQLIEESDFKKKSINNLKLCVEITPKDSYDLVKIFGSKECFRNIKEFRKFAIEKLSEEFALFYLQTLGENYKSQLWNKVDVLLNKAKKNYLKKWWQFKYPTSSIVEKLFLGLVDFKHHNILFSQQISGEVEKIKREKGVFFLKEFIENKDINISQEAIENVSDLINFMDRQQTIYTNNLYFAIITLIAVIVGAVLSFLLRVNN
ncbi:MAG: hypothetical protein WCO84_00660 [bacterium]